MKKRKLRLKKNVKRFIIDYFGIMLFYLIIILGVILLNLRFKQINANNNVNNNNLTQIKGGC